MTVRARPCAGPVEFPAIGEFLRGLYRPGNRDGNWLQPVWEYAYTHPEFDASAANRIGIWEDGRTLVGVATYELRLGEAFFQVHPRYTFLGPEMLAHAEEHLAGTAPDGSRRLRAFVADLDPALGGAVRARGYEQDARWDRPLSQLVIPDPFPDVRVPSGFLLLSLAEEDDLEKSARVLWRGFDHPGDVPAGSTEGRRGMQSGPSFRKDLTIVVKGPEGDFVAFAGLWWDPRNRFGYVEPVATDPDYRRRGLGTAVVLEGIRRCRALGAEVAYVGTDRPFYRAMGFRRQYTSRCWVKRLSPGDG